MLTRFWYRFGSLQGTQRVNGHHRCGESLDDDSWRSEPTSFSPRPSFSHASFPYQQSGASASRKLSLPITATTTSSMPVASPPPPQKMGQCPGDEDEPKFQLGTWANRQIRLAKEPDGTPSAAAAAPRPRGGSVEETTPGSLITQGLRQQQAERQVLEAAAASQLNGNDDQVVDAAWRWRFARRWHAEQTREVDPAEDATSGDKTEEALQFLRAGGGNGWNMQLRIAQSSQATSSDMASLMNSLNRNGSLRGFDSEMLSELSEEPEGGRCRGGGGGAGMMEATREVGSLHRRAAQLAKQQLELEELAQQRWAKVMAAAPGDGSSSSAGVETIPTVEIDDWGSFKFLVVRVSDLVGHQRIVVHGRNHCSEAAVVEGIHSKVRGREGILHETYSSFSTSEDRHVPYLVVYPDCIALFCPSFLYCISSGGLARRERHLTCSLSWAAASWIGQERAIKTSMCICTPHTAPTAPKAAAAAVAVRCPRGPLNC